MVRLSPFFDFGLALQAAVNTAFAGGKIRELKQTNLEDVKGKWRSRAIAPVYPNLVHSVFLFSNTAGARKKTCLYLYFYVVIRFCLIKISFTLFFYFALVSLVPRSSHRFSLATILNIISKEGWRFRSRDLLCPRVFFPAATILKNQKNFGTRLTVNLHLSCSLAFFSFLSSSYLRNFIGTRARSLERVVTLLKIQKN